MPIKEKEIAIYVGTFDASDNTFNWKKVETFSTLKTAYVSFKNLCKKCVAYSYEELMDIYDSPRLDISLKQGDTLIKWFGVYEKEIAEEPEEK